MYFNCLTNFFCIFFCISKPHQLIIICYTEYQLATKTICKCTDTFTPAFRSFCL